jgi:hypothetical protein
MLFSLKLLATIRILATTDPFKVAILAVANTITLRTIEPTLSEEY